MIAVYLATLLLAAVSVLIGRGVIALAGWTGERWPAGAVGFAVLLISSGTLVRLPHGPLLSAGAAAVMALAALAWRPARAGWRDDLREALPLAALVTALAMLPFFVNGRAYILGISRNDDMVAHLTASWRLQTRTGPPPVGALGMPLITHGYPLGPHAIATALWRATRISLVQAFDAVTLVAPVLTSLLAMDVLPRRPRLGRFAVAVLVGLTYLLASSLAEGAFKEPIEALLVLGVAVGVRRLVIAPVRPGLWAGLRAGVPLGVLAAGTLYVYSVNGLIWPAVVAVAIGLAEAIRRGLPILLVLWRSVPAAIGALVALFVFGAPDAHRLLSFAKSQYAVETGVGNLNHPISPAEGLGTWLGGDFRFAPTPGWPTTVLTWITVAGLVGGLIWWVRRRHVAVLGAAAGAWALYAVSAGALGIYASAKGLVVLSPITALLVGVPLLHAWLRARPSGRRAVNVARWAARGLGIIVLAGAGASTFLALRDAPVSAPGHEEQLQTLAPLVGHERTLYLGMDDLARWDLRGVNLWTGPQLYTSGARTAYPRGAKGWHIPSPMDFDNFSPASLDRFGYVITPSGAYQSTAPSNFHPVRRTADFILWRRVGSTPHRSPAERNGRAGAIVDCTRPRGRELLALHARAALLPAPVLGDRSGWRGQPINAGDTATLVLQVPAGDWDLSLQYSSATGLDLQAGSMRTSLIAYLGRIGPFWPAGTVHQPRSGPLRIRVRARPTSWFGQLLGTPGTTRAFNAPANFPLDRVALTRHGEQPRLVPVSQACGRYADWFTIPPQPSA